MNPEIEKLGALAKQAATQLLTADTNTKNIALTAIAQQLRKDIPAILAENARDIQHAQQHGISEVMADRLRLTEERIMEIALSVENIVRLDDPVGETESGKRLPNGLCVLKQRVPLGVVGIIYESRPNVTVDAAVLCLKTSNAVMLKGGKEAIYTNTMLVSIMRQVLQTQGLDPNCISFMQDTSREATIAMMRLNNYLDVLIPRGGAGLIQAVLQHATVPVIETGTGNCHVYVDEHADLCMALEIVHNAKTSRPSVCNACESLLVHQHVAAAFLPMLQKACSSHPVVEIRGCRRTREILGNCVVPAAEQDYATEFLDYILAVKIVDDIDHALAHINYYTTKHSECIVTKDLTNAALFTSHVDAAAVYVNASTRFTDGAEFGLGAEIGISTQKIHARGPMGLHALTSMKYVIYGNGQIR